jgi:5-(carboxyamino)imidazole ribonucleotide mutase
VSDQLDVPAPDGMMERVRAMLKGLAQRHPQGDWKQFLSSDGSEVRWNKVIVAGAGGAAHLPGMVAALTTLPVIGVPVQSRALSGVDSLHSIVQMPAGIPVATVAIGNGLNAGLLAAQILATADPRLAQEISDYRDGLHGQVTAKDARLQQLGSRAYLEQMG